MIVLFILLLSCSTEVGLIGYTEKGGDTSDDELLDTEQSIDSESSDTDDSSIENSGVTGYIKYKLRQVACPQCVGETSEISITFDAQFHEPITDSHTDWILEPGVCTDNLYTITPSSVPISVGQSISISTNNHSFLASTIGPGRYYSDQIWESQYQRDSEYIGTSELGSFSFVSSHGFDYIEPYTLLWVDPSYAYDAVITRNSSSSTVFTWGPTSSDSSFMITIAVYSWDGSQFLGRIDCGGLDSGYMSIPGSYFQQFPSGSLAAVHLVRHKVELTETAINNSFVETHTEWEVVGTARVE